MTNRLDNYLGHKSNRLMKSLYESAINGAITVLNYQIKHLEKQKEDAIEALEEERDALIEPLENQVDALEDERDAMEKANDQRERAINLTRAQYELERNASQRTRLIYKNGQMSYVNDYQEVRDTKQNLEDAIFDKKVGELDDQIDDLNKQIDEINEKYDDLIEQTEKFYDAQIESLQDLVDQWEEFQAQMELADALAALNQFGISMDDILSGNVSAFDELTTGYAAIVGKLNGSMEQVAQATGIPIEELKGKLDSLLGTTYDASGITQPLEEINNALVGGGSGSTSSVSGGGSVSTGGGSGGISGNATEVATSLGKIPEAINNIDASKFKDIDTYLTNILQTLSTLQESINLNNLATSFTTLHEKIQAVSDLLGAGGGTSSDVTIPGGAPSDVQKKASKSQSGSESSATGIAGALQQINDTDMSNIIGQLAGEEEGDASLLSAVNDVTSALGGGTEGGTESGAEGDGGNLLTALTNVTEKIGTPETDDTLSGNTAKFAELVEEKIPECTTIFEELAMAIRLAADAMESLASAMSNFGGISAGISIGGGGGFSGTAYANGNWSAKSKGINGNALVGEQNAHIKFI